MKLFRKTVYRSPKPAKSFGQNLIESFAISAFSWIGFVLAYRAMERFDDYLDNRTTNN